MKRKITFLVVAMLFAGTTFGQQIGSGEATTVTTFNQKLPSGVYSVNTQPVGYPTDIPSWTTAHGFVSRSAYSTIQITGLGTHDDRLFFRKLYHDHNNPNGNNPWSEIATRGENTFKGSQHIEGVNNLIFGEQGNKNRELRIFVWWNPQDNTGGGGSGYVEYPGCLNFRCAEDPSTWTRFKPNGDVEIGYGATTDKKLTVNGSIIAKEVRVQTNVWADFVFKSDYKLPALSDVKAHIEANQHLLGIPSEAEVKENGIGLAEMTTKLLQKVEELTLYAIQQQETINKLNNEVQELKNQK